MRARLCFPILAALLLASSAAAQAGSPAAPPQAPCAPDATPFPAYTDPGAPPAMMTWKSIELSGRPDCLGAVAGRMSAVVALAGSFHHAEGEARTLDALAARIGAISETVGLVYWSTTDGRWRELVDAAWALDGPDAARRRDDFTAAEVRSGAPLYFAQGDTRSTGTNLYRMTALQAEADRLVVQIANERVISFLLIPLFEADGLVSLQVIQHRGGGLWTYYGLTAVREGSVEDHEKSLVNRAAAFYRFLRGIPGDADPPLAR